MNEHNDEQVSVRMGKEGASYQEDECGWSEIKGKQ